MDGARDGAARDEAMPYGVDTIRLRISFPPAPALRGYNGRAWGMRPLRGWTGGAEWDAREAAAAAQASASSSLRATLDRVIAAVEAKAPAVEAQGGVQLAQAEPPPENETTRGVEPDEGPVSDAEVFRLEVYGRLRSRLKEIDPENPALKKPYLTGRGGFVPTEADLQALGQALDDAHSRRLPPEGPVNTFADPGGPKDGNAVQSDPDNNGKESFLPANPFEPATRPFVSRPQELNAKPTTSPQSRGSALQDRATIDDAIQNALRSVDEGVLFEGLTAQNLRNAGINVTGFQRYLYDSQANRIITDIDIETDKAIIETTVSRTGKAGRVAVLMKNPIVNPNHKAIIVYGERYTNKSAIEAITSQGGYVVNSMEELLALLRRL